jgi:putative membrane-bound dehydrogenase-like protein
VWDPANNTWKTAEFPVRFVQVDQNDRHHDAQARFGIVQPNGFATVAVSTSSTRRAWDFDGERWQPNLPLRKLFTEHIERASSGELGVDHGLRFRDIDGDGVCEIVVADPKQRSVWRFDRGANEWRDSGWSLPTELVVANLRGKDAGTRFVDINDDGGLDLVVSNEKHCGVWLFDTPETGWSKNVFQHKRDQPQADEALPAITIDGSDQGWAARDGEMIWINERTDQSPDLMERRRLVDLAVAEGKLPEPRSPQAGLRSLRVAPGYTVELVAAEPLIQDPVHFTWDERGRLWVVEMRDYPNGSPGGGRVRILTDTDGDGVYDSGTTFLEGIPFPTGVQPWKDGAIVCAAPDVFFARDLDGDHRADERTVLFTGFAEGNQQHRVNGPVYSLDHRLHCANGDSGGVVRSAKTGETLDIRGRDFSFDFETGAMRAETGQTQFGRSRDAFGNWFGNNNSNPLYQYVLEDRYVARNPHVAAPPLRVDVPAVAGNAPIFPLSRTLVRFNDFHTANRLTSACSSHLYGDTLFGADSNSLFVCEPVHNLVHRERFEEIDGLYRSARTPGEASSEFLASTDNWFRPVYATTGPDGALWVADMYRLVIEHPEWIPKAWQERLDLRAGQDKGRIYRVRPTHLPRRTIQPLPQDERNIERMIAALDHPNRWQRDTLQRLLLERRARNRSFDAHAPAALRNIARKSPLPESRVAALCTLRGWSALEPDDIKTALLDQDARVARHGVLLLEGHPDWVSGVSAELRGLVGRDRRLDRQLACSLGEFRGAVGDAAKLFAALATSGPGDRFVDAALASSLHKENLGPILETLSSAEVVAGSPAGAARDEWIVRLLEQGTALGDEQGAAKLFAAMTTPRASEALSDRLTRAARFFEMAARRPPLARWFRALPLEAPSSERQALADLRSAALASLADAKSALQDRTAAVRFLGLSSAASGTADSARTAARDLLPLLTVRQPDAVQNAVVESLGGWPAMLSPLAEVWPTLPPARRARLLDLWLAANDSRAELAGLVETGRVSPVDFTAAQRQQWIDRVAADDRPRVRKLLDAAPTSTRGDVVAAALKTLSSEGDAERGAQVFAKSCAACHKFAGVGKEIGPDIASLTDRSPEALVVAILDPNRAVEAKYSQFVVETVSGLTHGGIVSAETTGSLTLQLADGKELVLPREEIESLVGTGKSLMPEGLEKDLNPRDLSDLLAHLRSGVAPAKRREFAGNAPRLVVPEPGGHLRLSADACAIYGTSVVWEQKYGNLGYWSAEADRAEWTFQLPRAGRYRAVLEWACPEDAAGNGWQLESRGQRLSGTVAATGTWDDYRRQPVGELQFGEGTHTLIVRSSGPVRGHLWDLKGIVLEPVK